MEVTLKIRLRPFTVPNFVLAEEGPSKSCGEGLIETLKFRLEDLDPDTLEGLCDEFRTAIFKKAGKNRPPTQKA